MPYAPRPILFLAILVACAACSPADRGDAEGLSVDSARVQRAPGAAQTPAPGQPPAAAPAAGDSASRITGVGGVEWGTAAAQIVARRGEPAVRQQEVEGVETLGYPGVLAGQPVTLMYFVHPREGMFRGGYMAEIASEAQCGTTVGLFDQGIARRYSGLRGVPRPAGNASPEEPCAAFGAGTGSYMKVWTDAAGNRIMLALLPGNPAVVLTYTTPAADAWERRKNRGDF